MTRYFVIYSVPCDKYFSGFERSERIGSLVTKWERFPFRAVQYNKEVAAKLQLEALFSVGFSESKLEVREIIEDPDTNEIFERLC